MMTQMNKKEEKKKNSLFRSIKRSGLLISVLFFTVTMTVFGPIELFFTNGSELWFSFADLLKIVAFLVPIALGIPLLIGMVLPKKARSLFACVLFAVTLALYIQGNYANINYGTLDGNEVNWGAYPVYAILDTLGWFALIGAAVLLWKKKRKLFHKAQTYISLFVMAMQVLTLGILALSTDMLVENKSSYYLSEEGIYDISADENVIIFVLDAFDDAYFQDVYDDDPQKIEEAFTDFTYYENAAVAAARTKAALPAIITGQAYPGVVTYSQYIADAFNSDGLYSKLKDANYDVRIYTEPVFVPDASEAFVDNQVSSGFKVASYAGLTQKYFDFTCYKYMPHVLKRLFWLYTGDFEQYKEGGTAKSYVRNDSYFFSNMELSLMENKNVFRLYHLDGAHSPYKLNEHAQLIAEGTDLVRQAKGALYIVENYIGQMKELGVYDNSTIIIMADHGEESVQYGNDNPAHGILFVKEKNDQHGFEISSAPVSYFDLHSTIFAELGEVKGNTFADIPMGERNRRFYKYGTESAQLIFDEYEIAGHLNDPEAIRETGNRLRPVLTATTYQYGQQLTFGLNPSAAPFSVSGIGATDPGTYSWTTGKETKFKFPLEKRPKNNLLVTLEFSMVYTANGPQDIIAFANGKQCYQTIAANGGEIQFVVPGEVIEEDKILNLSFAYPKAVSPSSLYGPGFDDRTLALAVTGLRIDETKEKELPIHPTISLNERIEFTSENADAKGYLWYGFGKLEGSFVWTSGHFSGVAGILEKEIQSDLRFVMDVSFIFGDKQRVIVSAGDVELHAQELTNETHKLEFVVPKECIVDSIVEVEIELPDAVSPWEEGLGLDQRTIAVAFNGMVIEETLPEAVGVSGINTEPEDKSIIDMVALPLAALMALCYRFMGHYSLAIIAFTLLTKVILFPVSMWVQKNGIAMVKITPEINRLKIKYYGDKDTIADETQLLYKREKYNPLASTIPMIVQLVMLMGVISAVKQVMGNAETVLNVLPSEVGGWTLLMPLAAGAAALALGLAQNRLNPLQREQGKSEQWMTNGFSIAISLVLGAFVPLGVGIYWIFSNLFSIVQQVLLNQVIRPEKYIDYEDLARSKEELKAIDSLSSGISKADKKREKADYKRFFSIANKHIVFYSEKSGFYKYFKDVMEYILRRSNAVIHYVTSDPKDQIFEIAKTQTRIKPYYISENKLITLMMKMDADIVVMTVPDLNKYHLKRSYVRKDIEYIYMFHYPLSTHMVLQTGALDHYDTIFCVGEFQFDEIRAAERVYHLPEKNLIAAGYGQLEQLNASYQQMPKVKRERSKILIAPSWQEDNILDSCIDSLLEQLLDKGYEVVVRPHPEYVKRYKPRMDKIVERYQGAEARGLKFELDFTSNNSIFDSDVLISDWSGTAYEFSFVTLKPVVFIDTKPKINNPEYTKLGIEPLEFTLRSQVGIQVKPDALAGLDKKIEALLENGAQYEQKILGIREKYIASFGMSGEIGGRYIISQLKARRKKSTK